MFDFEPKLVTGPTESTASLSNTSTEIISVKPTIGPAHTSKSSINTIADTHKDAYKMSILLRSRL